MTIPAAPQTRTAAPRRVLLPAAVWMWIGLSAIVFGFAGAQHLGALDSAAGSPMLMALTTAAHADQQGSGYVDHIEWVNVGDRASLRIYPTAAARKTSSRVLGPDQAWAEVVKLAPEADSPGMREQFVCHWRFAELAKPGKVSWNLEPWRPQVSSLTMITSRCNPGGNEESY